MASNRRVSSTKALEIILAGGDTSSDECSTDEEDQEQDEFVPCEIESEMEDNLVTITDFD